MQWCNAVHVNALTHSMSVGDRDASHPAVKINHIVSLVLHQPNN